MLKEALAQLAEKQDLSQKQAALCLEEIMQGQSPNSQIGAFLMALRIKGETIDEITGLAQAMQKNAIKIYPKVAPLVDTCGTGGDLSRTFNISTLAAIVASAAGVKIAKHGNRAVSSCCGSADLLEALGVKVDLHPHQVENCINEIGLGFMFAPIFHPAIKHVMPTRCELGIRTVFNILGPLSNPASAQAQILGVFSRDLTQPLAKVLSNLKVKEAFVVHSLDGLDEISVSAKTQVSHLKNKKIKTFLLDPKAFKLKPCSKKQLQVKNLDESKAISLAIIEGKEKGSCRDIVLINAAAAILIGGTAKSLNEGLGRAKEAIDSGQALKKLKDLIAFSHKESLKWK